MATGQHGPYGPLVLSLAMEGSRRDQGRAPILNQTLLATIVLVIIANTIFAKINPAFHQCMATGQHGPYGPLVLSLAMGDSRRDQGRAPILNQTLWATIVWVIIANILYV
ncbi:hypothetical protein DPMN_189593 [Dreissena polymorpha]|uniref:Uncharacterized protein n=1 Tax=Dreissena polymorpha TaxID=45954 RepID=A0A9D4ICH8_DREPO|nr:hypothetical protein DPMN_189593 [Dreissena polymorpha]